MMLQGDDRGLILVAHGSAVIYACSELGVGTTQDLIDEVHTQYPNTKVIGYPYGLKEEDTLALIDDVLNTWGRLDVWVTSSGLLGPASISATTPASLYQTFEANSMAPFFALKYGPPAMSKTTTKGHYANAAPKDIAYGSIIVVSSVASTNGGCWGPAFTISSHAALGVVRAGVPILKGTNVRINCISPGQIDVGVSLQGMDMRGLSSQLPPADLQTDKVRQQVVGLERAGSAKEVARVAGFLASGFSSYMTGSNLVVDGGVMYPLAVPI